MFVSLNKSSNLALKQNNQHQASLLPFDKYNQKMKKSYNKCIPLSINNAFDPIFLEEVAQSYSMPKLCNEKYDQRKSFLQKKIKNTKEPSESRASTGKKLITNKNKLPFQVNASLVSIAIGKEVAKKMMANIRKNILSTDIKTLQQGNLQKAYKEFQKKMSTKFKQI